MRSVCPDQKEEIIMLKAFFQENSRYIAKYFINQIVMSFLGLCIGLPTMVLDILPISIIGCFFSVAMLCFLQYDFTFHLGEKHCYLPNDQVKPKKSLGLKIAIIGSIPTVIVIIIGIIFRLTIEKYATIPMLIYDGLNGTYVQLYAIVNAGVNKIPNLVLSGVIMWIVCLLFTLPGIISASLGYYLGSKDKPLRTVFGIKVNKRIQKFNR